ncbi:MAG TPA: ParA family protein [Acidimicrobiales bacterium]|nr:ParA family protein [Acidimicrobiales bacterium]
MRLAITNLKGGTGKTMTAVHLAAGLGRHGRTLLVDADPQGSATEWTMLMEDERPFDLLTDSGENLHRRIAEFGEGYAHIVIDTPPGHDAVVRSAILSATDVLVPPDVALVPVCSVASHPTRMTCGCVTVSDRRSWDRGPSHAAVK